MSTQNKEINHDFKIGDIVYILKDYSIRKGIVTAIECSICTDKETPYIEDIIYYDTKIYTVCLITEHQKIGVEGIEQNFVIKSNTYYKDSYNYDKVYANVDDLLSYLRNSVEKSL